MSLGNSEAAYRYSMSSSKWSASSRDCRAKHLARGLQDFYFNFIIHYSLAIFKLWRGYIRL